MMEKTEDELKESMGEETFEKLSDGEIEGVDKVRKYKPKDLVMLSIRDEIFDIVYKDCQSMKKTNARKRFLENHDKLCNAGQIRNEELLKVAFGKSCSNTFGYDYDTSLISNYIYMKIYKEKYELQSIEKSDKYIYKLHNRNKEMVYRGDTMNSWSTTLNEYMRLFGNEYLTDYNGRKVPENYKSWEDYLSRPEHYKNTVPDYISNFMKAIYTIGNFALVSEVSIDFNTIRYRKYKDYWDLTLLAIYEYYMGGTEGEWIHSLEKETKAKEEVLKSWLNRSEEPKDQKGWNNFVEVNFMQPFVKKLGNDQYGAPFELWDHHFAGKKGSPPKEKWQFEQFFVNARVRILERGKLIAQALVKAENKNNRKSTADSKS